MERPEVNDDLAKTAGWDTLDEMKTQLREQIRHRKEHESENQKRKQIGDELVARHDFEVPAIMVEEELNKALQDYARYLQSQGVNLEYAEIDWLKVRDEFSAEAENRVRRMLILNAVADAESIEVSDEEVDEEVRSSVRDNEFAGVRSGLRRDGTYEAIRRSLRRDKALKVVMEAAKILKEG
jgi:trigger factor